MDKNRLLSSLRPLRTKITLEILIFHLLCGGGIGISLGACVIAYSKCVFMPQHLFIALSISIFGALVAVLYAVFRKMPDGFTIASAADSFGFKQRFVTAYELTNSSNSNPSAFAGLVISDALKHAENTDFFKLYKIKAPKWVLAFFFLALALAVVITALPSPNLESFNKVAQLRENINAEAEQIISTAEEEASTLTDVDAKELMSKVDELIKELKNSNTEAESIRAVQKTQEELKRLSNNSVSKDLKALGEKLASNDKTRNLGESLQKADMDGIKKNMESLAELLQNGSDAELKALAEGLKELGSSIGDNPELSELLESLANAMDNGTLSDLSGSISELERSISEAASKNQDLRDAISSINNKLEQAANRISSERSTESDGTQTSGEDGTDQAQDTEGDGGQEQGGNGGQGQGNGGQGQGNGGQGQGNGGQGQGGGSGRGSGHIENENIYSRDAEAMRDSETFIQGEMTDVGNMNTGMGTGIGMDGGTVPYSNVFGAYRDEALRSLEDTDIPFGLREIVKDYFSSLE